MSVANFKPGDLVTCDCENCSGIVFMLVKLTSFEYKEWMVFQENKFTYLIEPGFKKVFTEIL